MELTEKDFKPIASRRIAKSYMRSIIKTSVIGLVTCLAAVAIGKVVGVEWLWALPYGFFGFMVFRVNAIFDRDRAHLAKQLYSQAVAEGVKVT
jgi:hypothetical protein